MILFSASMNNNEDDKSLNLQGLGCFSQGNSNASLKPNGNYVWLWKLLFSIMQSSKTILKERENEGLNCQSKGFDRI